MSHIDKKKKLQPSILDRLMDDASSTHGQQHRDQDYKISDLRSSIKRDLENLLNTRYRVIKPSDSYPQSQDSILNYGLPDLATVNVIDTEKQKEFSRHLEKILRTYEPRFKEIKIRFQENKDNKDRTLRFRIDAVLYADPVPEVIIFDSVLDPLSRTLSLEETLHG